MLMQKNEGPDRVFIQPYPPIRGARSNPAHDCHTCFKTHQPMLLDLSPAELL
jgi:hypothetical protein